MNGITHVNTPPPSLSRPLDTASRLLGLKGQKDHLEATLTVRAVRGPDCIINRDLTGAAQAAVKEAADVVAEAIETKDYMKREISRLLAIAHNAKVDIDTTRVQIADIPSLHVDPSCAAALNSVTQKVHVALDVFPPPSDEEEEDENPDGGTPIYHWSVHELDEIGLQSLQEKVDHAAEAVREMNVEFEARIAEEQRELTRLRDELPHMQRRLMASTTMADVTGLGLLPGKINVVHTCTSPK